MPSRKHHGDVLQLRAERADLHAWSVAERRFLRMDEDMIARALSRRAATS